MMNLQRKMKMIEDERQDMINNIKKLNVELENLTGTAPSSNELDASHSFVGINQNNTERMRKKNTDDTAPTILQVPRFMRPTFCSRGKSGTNHQTSENKAKFTARRRRPLSRAESVSFPVKCISEYNSDCSISKTSCLTGLNVESSADNGTEYTQDEYDIKKIVFQKQETSPESSVQDSLIKNEGYGNRKVNNCSSAKYLKVDNWLRLHKKEPTISASSHQTKQILAIPLPEKKHTCNGQKKDNMQDVEEHYYKIVRKNIANLEKMEKSVDVKGIDSPDQDNNPVNKWLEMQEAKQEIQCSNYFWSNSERSQHSKCDVEYRTMDAREDSGWSISISEQEPYSAQVPAEIGLEYGQKEDLDNLDQSSTVGSKPSILEMKSQKALIAGNAKPKNLLTTMARSKDNTKNSGKNQIILKYRRFLIIFSKHY